MTNPKYHLLNCSVCGANMGKKPGVQVVLGLVCDDPLCNYQPQPKFDEQRNAYIVALALDGAKVQTVALAAKMSRQRVYQIFDQWRSGV